MAAATPFRIAVLASGRGSNLQALINACRVGQVKAEVVVVGSDRAQAGALSHAAAAGIDHFHLDPKAWPGRAQFDAAMFHRLAQAQPQLIVLAGYMRILDAAVVEAWQGRMINIHPSLLPRHPGLHTHRKALQHGDHQHGASVHWVTAELDGGPLIAQAATRLEADDDEPGLAQRVLQLEHQLLPAVVKLIAEDRLSYQQHTLWLDGKPLRQPLQWPFQS